MGTGLLTDFYELTMLDTVLKNGTASRKAQFELFTRRLPKGMQYGVLGGTYRALDAIRNFSFAEAELSYLQGTLGLSNDATDYLRAYRFSGTVRGYNEGDIYLAHSPVLQVEGTLAECLVLETVLLSIFNWDSAVMTRASHCVRSSRRTASLLEMGSRRTHEEAAVAAARAAHIAGFRGTSNVQAGLTYGVPVIGTVAHAFILAHHSEEEAFQAQVERFGPDTTFLVDTYDIPTGIRTAVKVAGADAKAAVRIDSGDLRAEAKAARALLDSLGAKQWSIVLSGDMDENSIAVATAPDEETGKTFVDSIGVGTSIVNAPTPGFVYKLVAIEDENGEMRPVEKKAANKASLGGRKAAWRILREDGTVREEVVTNDLNWIPAEPFVNPITDFIVEGEYLLRTSSPFDLVQRARWTHQTAIGLLPSIDDEHPQPIPTHATLLRKEES